MPLKRSFSSAFIAMALCLPAAASAQSDLPVGSYLYDDLEYLEMKGLIPSAVLSTRPMNRSEARRLAAEAGLSLQASGASPEARGVIEHLQYVTEAGRPVYGSVYARAAYSDGDTRTLDINNDGDAFGSGLGARAGIAAGADIGPFSVYLNPEFRTGEETTEGVLREGYARLSLDPVEFTVGREAMWWGVASHGSLLLTNNIEPLEMIRFTTTRPVVLPWLLSPLGLFKPTVFVARLERDRDFPRANLLGMRLDFKPTPNLRFALARTFMFGGEGRADLSASDWVKVFFAADDAEHKSSPINGNQLASLDVSYIYRNTNGYWFIPFNAVKLYTEWGAEDSSGETKTPSNRASIFGALFDEPFGLAAAALRVEWADTARHGPEMLEWYTHMLYRSGYTYKGRVIGHHMGGDARDIFIRAEKRYGTDTVAGVEVERVWTEVHSSAKGRRDWAGADVRRRIGGSVTVSAEIGYEKTKGSLGDESGVASWLRAERMF